MTDLAAPAAVEHTATQPHRLTPHGVTIPAALLWRGGYVLAGLLAAVVAGGSAGAWTQDETIPTAVRDNRAGIEANRAGIEQLRESDRDTIAKAVQRAERLAALEARANLIERQNKTRDRLMLASLDVTVVGLRDIVERLSNLEGRGAKPMPPELTRGLNDLASDMRALRFLADE